jgi:hypothetical protein
MLRKFSNAEKIQKFSNAEKMLKNSAKSEYGFWPKVEIVGRLNFGDFLLLKRKLSAGLPSWTGADHKGASRATATRLQLENPCRRLVPLSTVDLTSRRRDACDPSTWRNDATTPQRRHDAAMTPRHRNDAATPQRHHDACDPSTCSIDNFDFLS